MKTMSPYRAKWLSRSAASFGLLLLLGLVYLLFGWGLQQSDSAASYELIAYWTEADGQEFDEPFGIAVDPRNGNVIITDAKAFQVLVLSESGDLIRAFGSQGDGPGQFENPTGVAVDSDGTIYVSDYDLDRIQKFSETGEFVLTWGSSGTTNEQFDSPNGVAVDATGTVYVADFYNKVVKVFDTGGRFLRILGEPGQFGSGRLDYPTDVAAARDGAVLVADAYNYRIQRFDAEGRPRAAWGWHMFRVLPRPADGPQGFNVPSGIAFSPKDGFVHVADSANHRVVLLDGNGAFVTDWTIAEEGSGYHSPVAVAVSPDGRRVYLTDIANKRVIVLGVKSEKEKVNEVEKS